MDLGKSLWHGLHFAFACIAATAHAGNLDGPWRGNLKCGPLLVNPPIPEFSMPIAMAVTGQEAMTIRETDQIKEQTHGRMDDSGTLSLSGEGRYKSGNGTPWTTRLHGRFSGNRFIATGGVFGLDGTRRRECSVDLTRVEQAINPAQDATPTTPAEPSPAAQPGNFNRAELIRLNPRPGVEQRYALFRDSATARAVAVLLTGGDGILNMESQGEQIRWRREGNSFVTIKAKDIFRDFDTAVAVVDAPSDWRGFGHPHEYRVVQNHVVDVGAIVKDVQSRIPNARIFLIGTSSGTVSAAYVGRALGSTIDGVVLSSTITQSRMSLSGFDYSAIKVPLLFVHQVNDPCQYTPYWGIKNQEERYPFIKVTGGDATRDNGCGPNGPHGFLGREYEVVREIKNWMYGRPYAKEIK